MVGSWVRRGEADATVVAFVHGILSSAETCWRHQNGAFWPEILASETGLGPFGVYLFGYRTGVFSGSYRLGDAVDALKEHLQLDGVLDARRIVFVCHSMGGILVRKYLVERAADLIERNIRVGLFLVASPSLGADYANWLAPVAKLLGHAQADALCFARDNAWLMDLDREFMNLKERRRLRIDGKELVEDRFVAVRVVWRKPVVESFSAARYFGEPVKVPGSDHFSIAKVDGAAAFQHRLLRQFILDVIRLEGEEEIPADGDLPQRLQALISGVSGRETHLSASYLFYVSRDRVASLFHQVKPETLRAALVRGRPLLPFAEPGTSSTEDRSRRALVNQLAAVLDHLSGHANIVDLDEAVSAQRLEADWYVVRADFRAEAWQEDGATQVSGAIPLFGIWRNPASAPWLWPGDRYTRMALHARRRKPSWPSVKRPMGGHTLKCPEFWVAGGKSDRMIGGREGGWTLGHMLGTAAASCRTKLPPQGRLAAAPINPQNPTPLNDQNDRRAGPPDAGKICYQ